MPRTLEEVAVGTHRSGLPYSHMAQDSVRKAMRNGAQNVGRKCGNSQSITGRTLRFQFPAFHILVDYLRRSVDLDHQTKWWALIAVTVHQTYISKCIKLHLNDNRIFLIYSISTPTFGTETTAGAGLAIDRRLRRNAWSKLLQ